jgi:hypothetical protein
MSELVIELGLSVLSTLVGVLLYQVYKLNVRVAMLEVKTE